MTPEMLRQAAALLGLTLLLAACGAAEPAAQQEHEHGSVVITQWNDSTELFLEYPHLLAGAATGNWAIHLSSMKTFKPVTEGTLTVRFLQQPGGEGRVFTLEAPARAGIFLLDPVIEEPGAYRVQLALRSPQVSSVHTLPEVRVFAEESELPHPEEEAATGIGFLKEQQWQIPFAVAPAREQELARSISVPGEIIPVDGALVQVSAPVSGLVLASSNRAAPSVGQAVGAGQALAVLSPISEESGYARAVGNVERLEREVARAERLYAAEAIAQKRLEEARHDLEVARAELVAMGGSADGDFRLRVRSPIAGVVAERTLVLGARVAAGEPLFTVVDPGRVWLRVHLPAAAASALARDSRATFTLEGSSHAHPASRLVSVGSVLDPATRTVPAIFEVDNTERLIKIGQFARASVPVGGTARGVAIPNSAILDDNGTPVAYVQVGGETFERRVLRLGASDGLRTQVLDGIRPEEMVVILGGYQVRLASMSGETFTGGHTH